MTTPKLYTATDGTIYQEVQESQRCSYSTVICLRGFNSDTHFHEPPSDLTPVRVVPKDSGVWIEGVTLDEMHFLLDEITLVGIPWEELEGAKIIKNKLRTALAQLTPSATTETEGGGEEECAGCDMHDIARYRDANPVPTPTVTIELTEGRTQEDFLNLMRSCLNYAGIKLGSGRCYFLEEIIEHLEVPLTSPRPEEPTTWGNRVKATVGSYESEFITDGKGVWIEVGKSFKDLHYAWSAFKNPTRVEGKE